MKKLLGIMVLGLLLSTNVYSACDEEDFIKHVSSKIDCMGLVKVGKIDKSKKIIAVFLHGYNGGKDKGLPYAKNFNSLINDNVNMFHMGNPGYKMPGRDRSAGRSIKGPKKFKWVENQYKWDQIELIAQALEKLKNYYKPEKLIVIRHSNSAYFAASMIRKIPGLIDKAILIACPCDYTNWTEDMGWGLMTINTDPSFQMEKIDPKTEIVLIVGKSDIKTKRYFWRT